MRLPLKSRVNKAVIQVKNASVLADVRQKTGVTAVWEQVKNAVLLEALPLKSRVNTTVNQVKSATGVWVQSSLGIDEEHLTSGGGATEVSSPHSVPPSEVRLSSRQCAAEIWGQQSSRGTGEEGLCLQQGYRLVGLVVKASASRAANPEFDSRLRQWGLFQGPVIPVTLKLTLQQLPCQASGIIGSVLGLVSPVSVYCDWVRRKVGSATSISVWQHVNWSEQIRP